MTSSSGSDTGAPHGRRAGVIRLGTRGSALALWQARTVAARITASGGSPCEIVVIKTSGDQIQDAPLSEIGGKRLFVKEIEDALLTGEIDLAVHSSKDMSVALPDGLRIGAVLPREDPNDAVVLAPSDTMTLSTVEELIARLGQKPSIGTGSVRRVSQLSRLLPKASFTPVRGNLDTRLRKLDEGQFDALVLAAAGLRRLGFERRISFLLPPAVCVPAPGQGIVAMEIRDDDVDLLRTIAAIDDDVSHAALMAERALVARLGGGCQTPIGALASPTEDDGLEIIAAVTAPDGSRVVRSSSRGPRTRAVETGVSVAEELLANGAGEILAGL